MEFLVAKAKDNIFQNEREISFAPEYSLIKVILKQANVIYNTCFDSKDKKLKTLTCLDIFGLEIFPLKQQSKISANKIVGTWDYIGRFDRKILEASFCSIKSVVFDRYFILPFIIYVKHVYDIIDEIEIDGHLRKLVESMWSNIPQKEKCTDHARLSDEDYKRLFGILLSKETYINDVEEIEDYKDPFKSDYLIDLVMQLIKFDSQAYDLCYPKDIIIPSDDSSDRG